MPLWHPLLAATPTGGPSTIRRPFGVNVRTTPHILSIVNGTWDSLATSLNLPFNGQLVDINNTTSDNSTLRWLTLAFLRSVNVQISDNTYDQDVDFVLVRNGVIVRNFFTILAGAAGEGSYRRIQFIPLQNDDTVSYAFVTGGTPPNGQIVFQCTADVQYGQGAVTNIEGNSKRIVISSPAVEVGGLANKPVLRFNPQANFNAAVGSGNESDSKRWTAYQDMFLGEWHIQQTRETGILASTDVQFLINGVVRFTQNLAQGDTSLHVTPLTEETFPGSGVIVPIRLFEGDTVEYLNPSWAGEPTLPRREFMNYFWADLL